MAEAVRAKLLADLETIDHGFFTRRGGVSTGAYASLNVGRGSDDAAEAVAENRNRVRQALGAEALATPYQVHGARVITVEAPFDPATPPQADGLVTARPGLAVGIVTADCAPVLLAEPQAGVVAAVHAGWRGAAAGVVEAAVAAMEALGAARERIRAALGPMIAQASYEVGPEVRDAFAAIEPFFTSFFAPGRPGKYQFDLEGAVAGCLARAQVGQVEPLGLDTYGDAERFFSYRRSTHRGAPDYGRQISAIALR